MVWFESLATWSLSLLCTVAEERSAPGPRRLQISTRPQRLRRLFPRRRLWGFLGELGNEKRSIEKLTIELAWKPILSSLEKKNENKMLKTEYIVECHIYPKLTLKYRTKLTFSGQWNKSPVFAQRIFRFTCIVRPGIRRHCADFKSAPTYCVTTWRCHAVSADFLAFTDLDRLVFSILPEPRELWVRIPARVAS